MVAVKTAAVPVENARAAAAAAVVTAPGLGQQDDALLPTELSGLQVHCGGYCRVAEVHLQHSAPYRLVSRATLQPHRR